MKNLFVWVFILGLLSFLSGCHVGSKGNIYYVDAENGCDSNDGLSPKGAWQSLEKVNSVVF